MTQARTKDGKFAKKEEYNPDHEPATKGFVKCLLRKTRDHTHEQNSTIGWCASGALIGGGYIIGSWFLSVLTRGQYVLGIEHAIIGTAAFVWFMVAADLHQLGEFETQYISQREPKVLNAYNPPCADKEKCE